MHDAKHHQRADDEQRHAHTKDESGNQTAYDSAHVGVAHGQHPKRGQG